jgi:hypothetical protein
MVRDWAQEIREATAVLYPADELARAHDARDAVLAGVEPDASHEDGLRYVAYQNLIAIATYLERWAGPTEGRQSQELL